MADLIATIHNERVKLSAAYLNGTAIALIAIGGFAPFVGFVAGTSRIGLDTLGYVAVGCICVSIALHTQARFVLRRLG